MKKKIALGILTFTFVFSGVFLPVSLALAQTINQASSATSAQDITSTNYESRLEPCWEGITEGGINISGCLVRFAYFISWTSAQLVGLVAEVLDFFIAYSIDSNSYQGAYNTFVEKGWGVIRDIANIFFIFLLLWIAIKHILQSAGAGTKKTLIALIIAALLINFSLFFTRIIIDGGNILARAFYNNIEITNNPNPDYKSITQGLADYIEPQKLVSTDLFKPDESVGRQTGDHINSGWAFFILAVASFVNITIALTFLSVFLLFAARVIGLWFMMIFSPLAFATMAIPGGAGFLGNFGFKEWLKQTLSLSFMAPIFLFFVFLTIMFLQAFYSGGAIGSNGSTMQKLMSVIIPFAVIIIIVRLAKDNAKKMSGQFGEAILKTAGTLAGVAIGVGGVALGGAGIIGRSTLGVAGRAAYKSETIRKATKSKYGLVRGLAKFTREGGSVASRSSFDLRNTMLGKRSLGLAEKAAGTATGQKIETKILGFDTQKGGGKGGYRQAQKDTKKKALERAEKRDMSYEESKKYRDLLIKQNDRARELEASGATEEEIKTDQILNGLKNSIKKEKSIIDEFNRGSRSTQAWWQKKYVWKAGRKEAADAVRAGKKPEGDVDKILKGLKDAQKEAEKEKGGEKKPGGEEKDSNEPGKESKGGEKAYRDNNAGFRTGGDVPPKT